MVVILNNGRPPAPPAAESTCSLSRGWRLKEEPGPRSVTALRHTGGVSIGEELLEERRRRRRAGDPRITPEGREILMRLVAGDLMSEFQAELDRVSAEDPDVGGHPVAD